MLTFTVHIPSFSAPLTVSASNEAGALAQLSPQLKKGGRKIVLKYTDNLGAHRQSVYLYDDSNGQLRPKRLMTSTSWAGSFTPPGPPPPAAV
jgi:hypothetical protein